MDSSKVSGEVKRKRIKGRTLTAIFAAMVLLTTIIPSAVMADSSNGGGYTLSSPSAIQENSEDAIGSEEDQSITAPVKEAEESISEELEITDEITEPLHRLKSIVPLALPGISDVYTVTFKAGGISPDKKIEVAKGDLCPKQAAPKAQSGEVFSGWYYEDEIAGEQEFDFETVQITKNLTVTAHFELTGYTVQFLSGAIDDSDSVVLYSANVAAGSQLPEISVDIPDKPVTELVFTGKWLIDGVASNYFKFDDTSVDSNMKLAPEFAQGYHVYFVTNGKTSIEPQVVIDGNTIDTNPSVLPANPPRDGYTFAGWYEDKNCNEPAFSGSAFNLSTQITESKTLYAKWTPQKVGYKVVIWTEKANIADPNIAEDTAKLDDVSNYDYSYDADIANNDPDAVYSGTALTELQTRALATRFNTAAIAKNTVVKYSSYAFARNTLVDGSGNAIVNIYMLRNIFTVNFDMSKGNVDPNAYLEFDDGRTYQTAENPGKYSFLCKFEQNLELYWPQVTEAKSTLSGKLLYGWPGISPYGYEGEIHGKVFTMTNTPIVDAMVSHNMRLDIKPLWVDNTAYLLIRPDYHEATQAELKYISDHNISVPAQGEIEVPDGKTIRPYISYNGKIYVEQSRTRQVGVHPAKPISNAINIAVNIGFFNSQQNNGHPTYFTYNDIDRISNVYYMWDRNTYSLSFNTTPGTANGAALNIKYGEPIPDLSDHEPTPPSPDYEFVGWQWDEFTSYVEGTTMPAGNRTLFAKWIINPHTVRFYENGTATEPIDALTQTVEDGKLAERPADLEKLADDTTFTGWYVKNPVNGTFVPYSFEVPITGDLDIYARWYPAYQPYEVVYNVNGAASGSVASDTNRYALGSKAIAHDGTSLKTADGKSFIGWSLGDSNILYHEGNTIPITNALANEDKKITLTAQYAHSSNTVSVTFKRYRDASDSKSEEWKTVKNATVTYPSGNDLDGFTKPGYKFIGWSLAPGGAAGEVYIPGSLAKLTESLTLYAVWEKLPDPQVEPKSYDVSYAAGGSNVTGLPSGATLKAGDSYKVSNDAPVRDGYVFKGWKVTSGGSGSYGGGETFTMPAKNVVLTAVWTPDKDDKADPKPPVVDPPEPPAVNPPRPPIVTPPNPPVAGQPVVTEVIDPLPEPEAPDTPDTPAQQPAAGTDTSTEVVTPPVDDDSIAPTEGGTFADLFSGKLPLGGLGTTGAWSLLSLLLSAVAVIISILLIIGMVMRRRLRDEYDEDEQSALYAEGVDVGAELNKEKKARRRARNYKLCAVVLGILTPIVWLILDNLNQPMVWINRWTIFVGIVFIAHIVMLMIYKHRNGKNARNEFKRDEQYA